MAKPDKHTKALLQDLLKVSPLVNGDPDVNVVRSAYDETFAAWSAPPIKATREDWLAAEGLLNDDKALVVTPKDAPSPSSTLIFLHGGGWMLGSAFAYAPVARWISAFTGFRVVVPDYPLAPEHPAPAAIDALTRLLVWVKGEYGGDIMLAGDSAGGQLAAVLSNHPPEGVKISAQALYYPVLDLRADANYTSRRKNGGGKYFLSNDAIIGAAMAYCANLNEAELKPDYSPILERDFSKTPPTYLLAPELDPLHDEIFLYSETLKQHGVNTVLDIAKGSIHGCISFSGRSPEGLRALKQSCTFLMGQVSESGAD